MIDNTTLETFILKRIKQIDIYLYVLNKRKPDFSLLDYSNTFLRLSSQKDILYECLTAHDNKYDEMKNKKG